MTDETTRLSLRHFADLLEYPRETVVATAEECASLLALDLPDAAAYIREFHAVASRVPFSLLEEIYTGTFDLDPVCYPYIGYHVFGETYKRSVFFLMLKERYRTVGIEVQGELVDHVSVMLRYLAASDDEEDVDVILREAMLPALQRMTGRAKSAGHEDEADSPAPDEDSHERRLYRGVLEALRLQMLAMAGLGEDAVIELPELAHRSLAH